MDTEELQQAIKDLAKTCRELSEQVQLVRNDMAALQEKLPAPEHAAEKHKHK
jgi:prefoldin subunit 5